MSWREYSSDDIGAPVINDVAGSLITFIDAIAVNGYGSKASLGWSKPGAITHTATKAVYLNGASAYAQRYYRILDDGSHANGGREASVRGYLTMSDADTGTLPFPTVAQQANGLQILKSDLVDGSSRRWYAYGDASTLIIAIKLGTATDLLYPWFFVYIGDGLGFKPMDSNFALLSGNQVGGTINPSLHEFPVSSAFSSTPAGRCYVADNAAGSSGSLLTVRNRASLILGETAYIGQFNKPNSCDGLIYLGDYFVSTNSGGVEHRGTFRGVAAFAHRPDDFLDEQIVYGYGSRLGRNYRLFKTYYSGATSGARIVAIEITDTVPTTPSSAASGTASIVEPFFTATLDAPPDPPADPPPTPPLTRDDIDTLVHAAACFVTISDPVRRSITVRLLLDWATSLGALSSTDPQEILAGSPCFQCRDPGTLQTIIAQLVAEIASENGADDVTPSTVMEESGCVRCVESSILDVVTISRIPGATLDYLDLLNRSGCILCLTEFDNLVLQAEILRLILEDTGSVLETTPNDILVRAGCLSCLSDWDKRVFTAIVLGYIPAP